MRIYDHGAKHGWQTPSLRVETQLRKDTADQHFSRLGDRCISESTADPLFVSQEERTVKDALMQHADLKDTTAWAGRPKPRNWASEAPRPDWYAEMLSHTADPLTIAHKAELDWDRTMEACIEQYGRKFFLEISRLALVEERATADVLTDFYVNCAKKLKRGDDALLASVLPAGRKKVARQLIRNATSEIARREEMAE